MKSKAVTDTRDNNLPSSAIEASDDVTDSEFDKLLEQKAKTKSEPLQRAHLLQLHGFPLMLPLVLRDDDGWRSRSGFTITRPWAIVSNAESATSKLKVRAVYQTQT